MNASAPGLAVNMPVVCLPPQPRPVIPPQHSSERKSAPAPFDDQSRPYVVFVAKQGPDDPWERVGLAWHMESSLARISSPVWDDIITSFAARHNPPPSKRLKTADGGAVAVDNGTQPLVEPLRGPTIVVENCRTERLGVILRTCHPVERWELRPASIDKSDLWAIYDIAVLHNITPTLNWLPCVLKRLALADPDDWTRECWKRGWRDGLVICCQLSYSPAASQGRWDGESMVVADRVSWKDADDKYFDACAHHLQRIRAIILRRRGVWEAPWLDVNEKAVWFSCNHDPYATRELLQLRTGHPLAVHKWFISALRSLQELLERHPTSATINQTDILEKAPGCSQCRLKAYADIGEFKCTLVRLIDRELEKVRISVSLPL